MAKEKLVFVRHPNPGLYLFAVPFDMELFAGDRVICNTRKRQERGVCACDSFTTEEGELIRELSGVATTTVLQYVLKFEDGYTQSPREIIQPPENLDVEFDELFF